MYGLGISQLAVMIGVVLYFPPVAVQTFVYNPCVSNGTLTHACGSTQSTRVMLPLPCMVVSAAAAVFVMNTRTLVESGVMTHESSYGAEIVGHMGLWDVLFWFVVAGVHAIVVLATCSPVDAFAAGGAVYLMVHFLMRLCSPPGDPNADHGGYQQAPGGMPSVSSVITVANANILGVHGRRGRRAVLRAGAVLEQVLFGSVSGGGGLLSGRGAHVGPVSEHGGHSKLPAVLGVLRVLVPGGLVRGVAGRLAHAGCAGYRGR